MSLLGVIGGALTGFATGGFGGAALGAAAALGGGGGGGTSGFVSKYQGLTGASQVKTPAMPGSGAVGTTLVPVGGGGPSIFPTSLPSPDSVKVTGTSVGFGAYSSGSATAYFTPQQNGGAACQLGSGTHLNKTGYFLKSGQYVAPRTKCVKNRRRNPLNPRALSRAMGRLASAKRAAKALDRFEVKGRRCR